MSETITAVIIATLGSVIGSVLIYVIALKKAKPENENLAADSDEHKANAVKSAFEGTEIVTKQLNATLADLSKEREERRKLEIKIAEMDTQLTLQRKDAENQRKDFEDKLISQKLDFDKQIKKQREEFERKFAIQQGDIARLQDQIVHLGGTPITNK